MNNYLYSKTILLPQIDYTGDLADTYLQLDEESKKIGADPNYRLTLNAWFNANYFEEKMPENISDIVSQQELQLQICKARQMLIQKISDEINQKINTIGVKYKTPPVTLVIQPFKYDEAEFEKLHLIAKHVVKSFKYKKHSSNEVILTVFLSSPHQ